MLGDRDPWIKNIAGGPYFMATYQLDWRHLNVKIHQAFSEQPRLVSELKDYLYSGQDGKMLTTVKLARLLCEDKDKRQKIADLITYIENNRGGLYGSRSLRDKVKAERVLVCSTGAIEKNISWVKASIIGSLVNLNPICAWHSTIILCSCTYGEA